MLSSAVTAATDAIIITDNDLSPTPTVLYANAAFTRLTGYTSEELVGRRTSETFGARMDAKTALRIQQVLSAGNEFHGEVTNVAKDGRTLHLELDIVPVRNSNGEITNFVAVRRDISRRRAHELNRQRLLHLVFEAQTEERRRISRELHDHAGQLLSSMLLRLEALQQNTTEASVKRAIGEISSVASSTLEDLSRLARGLHPAVLDDLGLIEALRRSLDEFQGAGISAKLITSGIAERLPQNVEHEIYQIVKEALTNVRKHSQARHVVLSLGRHGSVLAASIADDGVGFDSATASTERAGLGIVGMNERAALLGGTLSVHSRAGAGTVVNVAIPVSATLSATLSATPESAAPESATPEAMP
jgi:PAS domain S-box-containing protein